MFHAVFYFITVVICCVLFSTVVKKAFRVWNRDVGYSEKRLEKVVQLYIFFHLQRSTRFF
jgi:hypothetical protein